MEFNRREDKSKVVLDEYEKLVAPHIEASNGMMQVLEANPAEYPAQEYDRFHVEGDPQHAATVEFIAKTADSRFPKYVEALQSPENKALVSTAGEFIKSGGNVILLTNHGSLIDIALAMAGNYCVMDRSGYHPKTGIIISKTISRVGYVLDKEAPPIPASDVLKLLCDDIYLSFPRTESMMKSRIANFLSDDVSSHNRRLRKDIDDKLDDGGYMLAVAGSGATDKPDPNNPETITLGGMSDGMARLMQKKHTLVLPMAVWLHGEEAKYEFCGGFRTIQSNDEAHAAMQSIAEKLNEIVPDKNFAYTAPTPKPRSYGQKILDNY